MKRCDQGAQLDSISCEVGIELAEFFKMVGDSNRIRILFILKDREICVQHLASHLGMSQSAVSHQLRLLRQQKLVRFVKDGKKTYYSLSDNHVADILNIGVEHISHGEKEK